MATYTTAAPASATGTTGGRLFGKKKTSGPAALAKSQMKGPEVKVVEWRSKSSERWAIARARMQEQFTRFGASMKYGVYTITHPIHPLRRRAAKEAAKEKKAMAAERRVQQEAAAHSIAAKKRANVHQSRAGTLNQAVH